MGFSLINEGLKNVQLARSKTNQAKGRECETKKTHLFFSLEIIGTPISLLALPSSSLCEFPFAKSV